MSKDVDKLSGMLERKSQAGIKCPRETGYDTFVIKFIYQQPEWPTFCWNSENLGKKVAEINYKHRLVLRRMQSFSPSLRKEISLEALVRETFFSSKIEGENVSQQQIRSVSALRLGLEEKDITAHNAAGIVDMLYDAIYICREPLTTERLFTWHAGLFPTETGGLKKIRAGAWRKDEAGPMRVVSGAVGREKAHYEAPAAERIEAEMAAFLECFNGDDGTDLVLRAGIAHLWFVTIHPFEDGNGRIARAIANMMLARSKHGSVLFCSLSEQIFKERGNYYRTLERAQKGTLDITEYLSWFLECIDQAISAAYRMIENLRRRAYFQDAVFPKLNIRQRVVIGKLLDDFRGKLTQVKWSKLAKCTQDAAARDIDDLMTRGILVKDQCNSRAISYSLAGVSNSNYREAMSRAAIDNEFITDSKEVERDFVTLDAEATNSSDKELPRNGNKPTYGRDENDVFRLYPDGHKKYCREKRFRILSRPPLNPPLEAIQTTMKRAIAEIHAAGLATVHCDDKGRVYLLYPDGRKKYCKPVRSCSDQESDD